MKKKKNEGLWKKKRAEEKEKTAKEAGVTVQSVHPRIWSWGGGGGGGGGGPVMLADSVWADK